MNDRLKFNILCQIFRDQLGNRYVFNKLFSYLMFIKNFIFFNNFDQFHCQHLNQVNNRIFVCQFVNLKVLDKLAFDKFSLC